MLVRIPKWAGALDAYLRASQSRDFQYGNFDCCLFVADGIRAMTETDIAVRFRGEYASRRAALAAGDELCGGASIKAIVESVTEEYGMEEVRMSLARRGDMVAISRQNGRDLSLGLISLSGREILIAGKIGWGPIPIDRGARAWRVG